jgi:hypothetical protein
MTYAGKANFGQGKVPKSYVAGAIVPGDIPVLTYDASGNPEIQIVSSSISRSLCTEHKVCGIAQSTAPYDTLAPSKGFGATDDAVTWGGGVAASASYDPSLETVVSYQRDGEAWAQIGTSSGVVDGVTGSTRDYSKVKVGDYVRAYALSTVDSVTGRHSYVRYGNPGINAVATSSTFYVITSSALTAASYKSWTASKQVNDTSILPSTARSLIIDFTMIATGTGAVNDRLYVAPSAALVTKSSAQRIEIANPGGGAGYTHTEQVVVELDADGLFYTSASPTLGGDMTVSAAIRGYYEDDGTILGKLVEKRVLKSDAGSYWAEGKIALRTL